MKAVLRVSIVITLLMIAGRPTGAEEGRPRKPDRLFECLIGGYVALQTIDVYLTHRGTSIGMTEANPVFASGGSVVAAKTALVPLTTVGLVRLHRRHPKLATALVIGLDAVYLGVARNNLKVINEAD